MRPIPISTPGTWRKTRSPVFFFTAVESPETYIRTLYFNFDSIDQKTTTETGRLRPVVV